MLKRFWLWFAQAVTVLLALLFIVSTLKPLWLQRPRQLGKQLAAPLAALQETAPNLLHSRAGRVSYADAAQKAMPAVVNVFSSKGSATRAHNPRVNNPLYNYFFGNNASSRQKQQLPEQTQELSNLGSGVIVSSDGYILTNEHVIDGANEIDVALSDGRETAAKVIGVDPETDLAVLKVDLHHLPTITLGHMEGARVGDVVLAIGNPFGVGQTVTMGIISALGRNHLGINIFENFIQTDAPINPGNSGGALIDTNGDLLGINTAIYSSSGGSLGIGFAVPVTTARNVLENIIKTGTVTRGWVGIELQDLTPEITQSLGIRQNRGAIISGVVKNSPADRGGIKPGDILLSVNNEDTNNTIKLLNVITQIKPGTHAQLHVIRKNRELTLSVKVGKRPPPPKEVSNDDTLDN